MTDDIVSKTSELKAVVQEPKSTYTKSRRSNYALTGTSTSSTDIDALNITKHEDTVAESARRNTDLLVRNLKKISDVKSEIQQETLKEKEEKVKKRVNLTVEETSSAAPLRGEQLIKEKHRGSIFKPRMSVFRALPVNQTSNEVQLKDPLKGEERYSTLHPEEPKSMAHLTADSSLTTQDLSLDARIHFSTNVVVQNLLIDTPPMEPLPLLVAVAYESVLQECLDCMKVLQYVIPAEVDERYDDTFKTIDEKYGVPDEPRVTFREDMGLPPLVLTIAKKMQRDRKYMYDILEATLFELKHHRTYDRMEVEINDIVKIQESEYDLEVDCQIWMGQVKQLQELIEADRMKNDQEKKRHSKMAQKISALVDDSIFLNTSKLGYVESWENARLGQRNLQLGLKENELMNALDECAKLERAEQIVSGEVQTYLQTNAKDVEDEIMMWTSQYNEEIERREQEINALKERIENEKMTLEDLYALRDERQVFIDECYAEKDRLARDEEYWRDIYRAATIIQSLWRGVMVREQLGQFKDLWASLRKRKKLAAIAKKKKKKKKKEASEMETTKKRGIKSRRTS